MAILVLGACASKAPAPPTPSPEPAAAPAPAPSPKAPEKVAKQRTVVTKVPVLVRESAFYADGLLDEYVVYKLDDAKKLTLECDRYDTVRPDPILRRAFEYKDGREAVESVFEADGKLRSRLESGYDSEGRLVSERLSDAAGKPQSSSSYAYDARGRKIEWKALDGAGGVKAVTTYAYGPDGLSAISMRDSGGALTGTIKLEYSGGRLAKRSYLGADGALQKYEAYSYQGSLVSFLEVRRADGSLVSRTGYERGPLGEVVQATEFDASGKAGNFTMYEYAHREDSSIETYYE